MAFWAAIVVPLVVISTPGNGRIGVEHDQGAVPLAGNSVSS
ncbi:hypothetical protein WKI65_19650 [Streptomyces sp. MS1.AVA.3]